MLAWCGGSQPPIGASGAMPRSLQRSLTHAEHLPSSLMGDPVAAREAKSASFCGQTIERHRRPDPRRRLCAHGIFIDTHSHRYVTNGHMSGRESVEIHARAATDHSGFILEPCLRSTDCSSDDTLHRRRLRRTTTRGRVLVYPPGKTQPSRSFFPGGTSYCLTLDAKNNLYVGYSSVGSYAGQVERYRPGAKDGVDLIPPNTVHFLTSVAVDEHGAGLVAIEVGGAIDVSWAK